MSDLSSELDLKFLPDWLKEGPTENRYANFQGDTHERGNRGDRDRGGSQGGRPGGGRPSGGGGRPSPGGPRNDRRSGPPRPGGDRRDPRRDDRAGGGAERRFEPRPPAAPLAPTVRVEFLPEPNGVTGIAKQIRSGFRAYPLFGTARMFLEKPERHRVRITSLDAAKPLFQIDDGPISFDRTGLERNAFQRFKDEYYKEEVLQGDPIKGKFTNVARSRSTGAFLGPTNYHSYQPAMRKLYEERFSRRMSFSDFQQEDIVVVTDEQIINDWKEQARSSTTFTTLKEAEPVIFKSGFEAEQHFKKTYLPQLIKTGVTLETNGAASRDCTDRGIIAGLREAWEQERGFPGSIVHHLRSRFVDIGLHFFKHRKRVLYISPIRPQRHASSENFSEGIASILSAIEEQPKITRPLLAKKLLGDEHESPELLPKKSVLASDLHYLIHAGNVIEFHDGTLDLPLSPKAEGEISHTPVSGQRPKHQVWRQKPLSGAASLVRAERAAAELIGGEAPSEADLQESAEFESDLEAARQEALASQAKASSEPFIAEQQTGSNEPEAELPAESRAEAAPTQG
ncbi:MAG: hypothetical protein JWL90_1732 [Chthoniobacteraceae bacterium]|nr:hypothetical protein [Chthoniobacteraceae bacterium]